MPADLDLAEVRRLAEALSQVGPDDELPIYWRRLIVKAGDEIPRLVDRLEAAEARTVELVNELDDERVAYAELLGGPRAPVPCDCGRALLPVAGRVGLWSCPPCGVSYSFGVPGAVAREPGGEQQ